VEKPLSLGQIVKLFLLSLEADVRAGRNKHTTWVGYELQLRKFLQRIGPDTPAEGLRRVDLLPHLNSRHEIQAVQRLLKWATDEEPPLVNANPARKLKLPPTGQRTRTFSRRELVVLKRRARRHIRDLVLMMEHTFARPQECRPMCWRHIREDGAAFVLTDFKAKRRRKDNLAVRVIAITPRLARLLERLRRRQSPDFGVFVGSDGQPIPISPRRAKQLARLRLGAGEYPEILLGTTGKPLTTGPVCKSIRLLREKLGMDKGEPIVLYTCRHTSGTRMTRDGRNQAEIANAMGHASQRTTERYQHLTGDDVINTVNETMKKKLR
jgi:integrase